MMVAGSNLSSTGGHSDTHYNPYLHEVEVHPASPAMVPPRWLNWCGPTSNTVWTSSSLYTGGVMSLGTTVGAQQMSYEEMKAICDTAKMYGMITATHAHLAPAASKMPSGLASPSVEHGMMMDEEGIQLMKEHGTTLVPTIIAAERIIVKGKEAGTPDWAIAKAKQVYDRAHWGFTRCMEEGILIAFGTDSGTPLQLPRQTGL